MKEKFFYRILVLAPSAIGFLAALLLTKKTSTVDDIYLNVLLFQIGGGFFGSLLGFRLMSKINLKFLIFLIPLTFGFSTKMSLFLSGIVFSAQMNKFVYENKMLKSLLVGFIQPSLFLVVVILEMVMHVRTEFALAGILAIVALIFLILDFDKNSDLIRLDFSFVVISLIFGLTNYATVFSFDNMFFVLIEKVYLALFVSLTVVFFREDSIQGNFNLLKRLGVLNNSLLDLGLFLLGFLCAFSSESWLITLLIGFYFHAKSSLLFRVVQVENISLKALGSYVLLLPFCIYFESSVMLLLWFISYNVLKSNLCGNNL